MSAPTTHNTFVIGLKDNLVTFLKSYDYDTQKEEAQKDLEFVQDKANGFTGWYITSLEHWLLVNRQDYDELAIDIKYPI